MRRAFLIPALAALTACAAGKAAPERALAPASFFELPPALRADPAALRFAPLQFEPPEPRIERWPNGLTVYLMPDRSVPLVQLQALVALGNLDDPPEKVGLAQVVWSALQTGGAGARSAAEVDRTVEGMAALLAAEASDESAHLAMEVRTADLARGLALFADLLRRPRFEEAAVQRVLEQGRDAVVRRADDAGHVAQVAFAQAVWGEQSPFAREPSLTTLAAIGRDDLVAFHQRLVVPGAVRLVITGDIEPEVMLGELRKLFGDWPAVPVAPRRLPAPPQAKGREVLIVPTSGAQAKIRLGHLGPARHDPREFALKLLDATLGGGEGSSRLYAEIRDKRGLAYSVESGMGPGLVRGLVVLAADTKPESAHEVIARCIEELEAIRGPRPPTEAEISLAREGAINAFAFRFERAALAATLRAESDLEGYPADYFQTYRARLSAVTAEQVSAAARQMLDPHALQIVVVGDPQRLGDLSEFGPVRFIWGTEAGE